MEALRARNLVGLMVWAVLKPAWTPEAVRTAVAARKGKDFILREEDDTRREGFD